MKGMVETLLFFSFSKLPGSPTINATSSSQHIVTSHTVHTRPVCDTHTISCDDIVCAGPRLGIPGRSALAAAVPLPNPEFSTIAVSGGPHAGRRREGPRTGHVFYLVVGEIYPSYHTTSTIRHKALHGTNNFTQQNGFHIAHAARVTDIVERRRRRCCTQLDVAQPQ